MKNNKKIKIPRKIKLKLLSSSKKLIKHFKKEFYDDLNDCEIKDFIFNILVYPENVNINNIIEDLVIKNDWINSHINDFVDTKTGDKQFNQDIVNKFINFKEYVNKNKHEFDDIAFVDRYTTGYYFLKKHDSVTTIKRILKIHKDGGKSREEKEIFLFSKIKNIDYNIYDIINKNVISKKRTQFVVPKVDKDKREMFAENYEDYLIALNNAKNSANYNIVMEDRDEVIKYIKKQKSEKVNYVTCNCFCNNTYYHVDNDYYPIDIILKKNQSKDLEFVETSVSSNYERFINTKYNKKDLNKIVDIINKLPRNDNEAKEIAKIDAWSNASTLKMELRRKGIKISPILLLIGPRGTFKSTRGLTFISQQWCTETDLTEQNLNGSQGARLVHIDNTCYPRLFDEVSDLKKHTNMLKSMATDGYLNITKGRKDQGINKIIKYFSMALTSNSFNINDNALKSRFIYSNYNFKTAPTVPINDIVFLDDNIKQLGKKKQDMFKDYDFDELIKKYSELYQKQIKEFNINHDEREKQKFVFLMIGRHLSKDLNILTDVKLTVKDVSDLTSEYSLTADLQVKNMMKDYLKSIKIKIDKDIFTLQRILNTDWTNIDNDILKNNIIAECSSYGVYFSNNFENVCINNNTIYKMNEKLDRNGIALLTGITNFLEVIESNKKVKDIKIYSTINKKYNNKCIIVGTKKESEKLNNLNYINYIKDNNNDFNEIDNNITVKNSSVKNSSVENSSVENSSVENSFGINTNIENDFN